MEKVRKNLRYIIPVVILAFGIWLVVALQRHNLNGSIQASGTIEAEEVRISTEMTSRILEVAVQEGDPVSEGMLLFKLDGELLQAQRDRAVAALESAEDGETLARAGVAAAEAALEAAQVNWQAAQANAKAALLPLEQALDELNDNTEIARAQAEQNVAAANRLVRETTYMLDNYTVPVGQQKMTASEAIADTKIKLDKARKNFEPYKYEDSGNDTREDLKESLDLAQADYDAAVRRMEYESAVAKAQAALVRAQEKLADLANGPDPDEIAVLNAKITAVKAQPDQLQAAVVLAEAGLAQAQARLSQAISQLGQAKAEAAQIEIQIKKSVIYSPSDGTVISSNLEPGEVIQPGAEALTIGRLQVLKITVYLPEDRLGKIRLGMSANVKVDSFPGRTFKAEVVRIADKAEFTPRNVQTEDGRRTTVFAIELSIVNPDQLLKPGMPADVFFGQ